MDYQEYVAKVKVLILDKEFAFEMPYLDGEYDKEAIYEMAVESIENSIQLMSYSIEPM